MRKKDSKKIESIKNAVIQLAAEEGLSTLTTARIAKQAGVSPATIYLTYDDKIDLLSKVYQEVKEKIEQGLSDAIDVQTNLDRQIKDTLAFTVKQYKKYPKFALFMGLMWQNQDFLDDQTIQIGKIRNVELEQLFERLTQSDDYISVSYEILESFFAIPTSIMIRKKFRLSQKELDDITSMIIKAIKK